MAHVGIDVNRFADLEHDRIVKLRVHLGGTFENMDVFLAGVADQGAELGQAFCAYPGQYRDHALAAQLGAQVVVIVIRCIDADCIIDSTDAAASGDRCLRAALLGEQFRHADVQALTELNQLVVGEGQAIVFDFG